MTPTEISESEIVQQLADEFGLTANDTIGTLVECLQEDESGRLIDHKCPVCGAPLE